MLFTTFCFIYLQLPFHLQMPSLGCRYRCWLQSWKSRITYPKCWRCCWMI